MKTIHAKFIGAIDQGTTSTRFVIFDHKANPIGMHQIEHQQIYPKPDWVEHDPLAIKDNMFRTITGALAKANIQGSDLAAIGITNQRETTVVWDKRTGQPYYNAIVWQDTRTSALCKQIAVDGDMNCFAHKVGLPLTTYFSGPKIRWILENIGGVKEAAVEGNALFGTIDTWLIWWLTGGPNKGLHITDVTNASRTMLMNINTLNWDPDMLAAMGVPLSMLPEIKSSSEIYGTTEASGVLKSQIPISGILGDQQAALFGQTCFQPGDAKNTYGTGCFLLLNTGHDIIFSRHGLLTTPAYKIGDQPAVFALEGSIAIAGSLVQWVRDNIGLIAASHEIEKLASTVSDNGGIFFVPAFSGLFAPHWRDDARGIIVGLTHYINKGHIARAVLEACAFQTKEIFEAMVNDSGIRLSALKVDGGMVANNLLMQFQADILGIPVIRPNIAETTVLGAAYAAGLSVGFWEELDELKANWQQNKKWLPNMLEEQRAKLFNGWHKAVKRSYSWTTE